MTTCDETYHKNKITNKKFMTENNSVLGHLFGEIRYACSLLEEFRTIFHVLDEENIKT